LFNLQINGSKRLWYTGNALYNNYVGFPNGYLFGDIGFPSMRGMQWAGELQLITNYEGVAALGSYFRIADFTNTRSVYIFPEGSNIWSQRNGTAAQANRLYNTYTSGTNFERLSMQWTGNELVIDTEAGSGGGTLRGIKLGSASTSPLGFYGATPVVRPAAVADATDAVSAISQLNQVLARLRTLGLIAT
jgi:hypothetical protein